MKKIMFYQYLIAFVITDSYCMKYAQQIDPTDVSTNMQDHKTPIRTYESLCILAKTIQQATEVSSQKETILKNYAVHPEALVEYLNQTCSTEEQSISSTLLTYLQDKQANKQKEYNDITFYILKEIITAQDHNTSPLENLRKSYFTIASQQIAEAKIMKNNNAIADSRCFTYYAFAGTGSLTALVCTAAVGIILICLKGAQCQAIYCAKSPFNCRQ